MSSILDALNKLEDEKELAREQDTLKPEDIDARSAADEMIGQDVMRDKFTLRVSPMMLVGAGLFGIVLVVAIAATVTVMLTRNVPVAEPVASLPPAAPIETASPNTPTNPPPADTRPVQTAPVETPPAQPAPTVTQPEAIAPIKNPEPTTTTPPPTKSPVAETPESKTTPTPPVSEPATIEPPEPTQVASIPAPTPAPVQTILAVEAPQQVEALREGEAPAEPRHEAPTPPTPKPTPIQTNPPPVERVQVATATPAPTIPEPITPSPAVAPAANVAAPAKPAPKVIAPRELDVQSLKPLPGGMITRYGLDELKINMVNPQSDRNPYGSAIINGKKVFENSYISGSQIMLKKVVDDGIAVEISRTGEQFYKHF